MGILVSYGGIGVGMGVGTYRYHKLEVWVFSELWVGMGRYGCRNGYRNVLVS
mgnify:CR=1 FL=1